MIRNFKALGLAFVAVLAVGALTASGASAAKIVSSGGADTLEAEQSGTHVFELTDNSNLKTTCTTAKFSGNIPAGGTETPVAHPTYEGCTAFGIKSTITTTGCDYEFHIGALSGGSAPASVDVECGSGSIVITTLTCELKVGTQQGLESNTGTNQANDVVLNTEVTGIDYEVTKDGIGCPLSKVGSFTEGDYDGTTTLEASGENSLQLE